MAAQALIHPRTDAAEYRLSALGGLLVEEQRELVAADAPDHVVGAELYLLIKPATALISSSPTRWPSVSFTPLRPRTST